MNDLLAQVAIDLQQKYQPHTIILYGSRARGDHSPASDIDVVCFVENGSVENSSVENSSVKGTFAENTFVASSTVIQDARDFAGLFLDAWVYPSTAMSADNDELLRVADGYCLYDVEERGETFLRQMRQRIEQGPKQLSATEIQHTKQWVSKMLQRSQGSDVESLYRRYWLAVDLLQIYFNLRGQWYFGSKKSLAWLKKHDSTGYQLFSALYEHNVQLDDLNRLSDYVINP